MTENEKIKKTIEVFEMPSKHIKCVYKCENGMEFLAYSQDLVLAFETAIDGLKELQQYRSIGTVEECREVVERQRAKKYKTLKPCESVTYYQCPVCGGLLHINENFCGECGQAISWEESGGMIE